MYQIRNITPQIQLGILHLPDFKEFTGHSEKRVLEKNGALFLLEKIMGKKTELAYHDTGKPYLKDQGYEISISHSFDKLVISTNSSGHIGVDIEIIRDKVLKIQNKFLNEKEIKDASNDVEKLLIYWACKEALFKYHGRRAIDFIEHIFISPFEKFKSEFIIGEISTDLYQKRIKLGYEKIEEYVLVYTINEIS